jgi:hypothetical protein
MALLLVSADCHCQFLPFRFLTHDWSFLLLLVVMLIQVDSFSFHIHDTGCWPEIPKSMMRLLMLPNSMMLLSFCNLARACMIQSPHHSSFAALLIARPSNPATTEPVFLIG